MVAAAWHTIAALARQVAAGRRIWILRIIQPRRRPHQRHVFGVAFVVARLRRHSQLGAKVREAGRYVAIQPDQLGPAVVPGAARGDHARDLALGDGGLAISCEDSFSALKPIRPEASDDAAPDLLAGLRKGCWRFGSGQFASWNEAQPPAPKGPQRRAWPLVHWHCTRKSSQATRTPQLPRRSTAPILCEVCLRVATLVAQTSHEPPIRRIWLR